MHNSAIAICCFCFLGFLGVVLPSLLTAPKEQEPIIIYQTETTTISEATTTETVTTTTEIILESVPISPELSEEELPTEEEEVIEYAEEVQED